MSKIYYKVTTYKLRSIICSDPSLITQYKIDEFVSSPVPETPLCVFETIEDAKKFCDRCGLRPKIFKCEIKTKLRKRWIPFIIRESTFDLSSILRKIKNKKRFMDYVWTTFPEGTVCAKQVKLLEEIK